MNLTALADHLAARRADLLAAWCRAVEADPRLTTAPTLSRVQFHDHIPEVLAAFEAALRARGCAEQEAQDEAAAHGRHRWQQGFHLRELLREWGHLHLVLLDEIETYLAAHPEIDAASQRTARRLLAELCGGGACESADQFFTLRQTEAAGNVRDLERTLAEFEAQERRQGETWREAAHDLRGSLGVFRNVAFVLGQETLPDRMRASSVALLQKSALGMQALLEDVLSLARLQAGQDRRAVRPFDAAQELLDLCDLARPLAAERKLDLHAHGPEALPVEGDAVKVRRIVQNLVLNALKYTQQGCVTVTWGDSKPDDPQRWAISVRDTGPGLRTGADAPLTQALAETTQEANEVAGPPTAQPQGGASPAHEIPGGEGIGLSIVKRLCELLDATLEVESAANVGTTFRVILPRVYG